jgi:primosomal protein N''
MSQHPYLHYLYSKERVRDFQRAAARHHLIDLEHSAKPRTRKRVAMIWLADRLIATGEMLRRRYTATAFSADPAFTPAIDHRRIDS